MIRFSRLVAAIGCCWFISVGSNSLNAQEAGDKDRLRAPTTNGRQDQRLTSEELRRHIRRAGFEVVDVHDEDIYEIEASYDDWTFPVLFEVSPNQETVWSTFVLQEFPGPLEHHAVRFAKLMSVNGMYGNVFFKFDPESRLMMLVGSIENDQVAPSDVDELIGLLATIAIEHESLWSMSAVEPEEK